MGEIAGMAWLQYGSFGALVLVLIAVGIYVNRMTERQQVRSAATETWMKDLVEADREERKKWTDVLTELVRASVEAQQAMVRSLNGLEARAGELADETRTLAGKAAEYDAAAQERYREILKQVERNR